MNVNLQQIVARKIKGYAFIKYPTALDKTPQEYRARIMAEVEQDYKQLTVSQFTAKYKHYIY